MPTRRPDFEARLRFLSPEEGGRKTPVFRGYRADFRYLDDPPNMAWMIHPREFIDEAGELLPEDTPITGIVHARFWILVPEYRISEHRRRISVSTQFYVVEGSHIAAEGTVTKIVGLFDD